MLPSRLAALAVLSLHAAFALPRQEPAEIRAYLARLAERGLSAEVVREGETFLRANPRSPDADVVRYRIGCAQLALGREAEGVQILEPLARRADFEFAAESAVRAAEAALRANDGARAERLLVPVEGSARGSTRDSVRILLGRARLAAGRPEEAVACARSLRRDTQDPGVRREALLLEAWATLRAQQAEAAAALVGTLLADPDAKPDERAEAQLVAGEALLDAGRPADALAAFESVPEGGWRTAALRGAGFARAALGLHADAARTFSAAVRAEPAGPHAVECALHVGIEQLAAKDARAARSAFGEALLDAHPDAAEWRARAALADGDTAAALQALERAPAPGGDPDRARRLARLRGEVLERAGRGADAARAYAESGAPAGMLEAARASLSAGDAEAALRHAERLLGSNPEPSLALAGQVARGEAAFRLERWSDARAAFDTASQLEADPTRAARIRLRAAWSAWRQGAAREAAQWAQDAAARLGDPEHEEAAFLAARALESLKDPASAAAWRAYLERHAASPRAGEAAQRLARSCPPDEARQFLGGALQRETDAARRAEIAFELGELESRAKDFAAARSAYERALSEGSGSIEPPARYGLAFACATLGDDAAAERALSPLLASSDLDAGLVRAALELGVTLRVRSGDGPGALARWRELERAAQPVPRALASLRPILPLLVSAGRAPDAEAALVALGGRADGAELARIELERGWLALGTRDDARALKVVEHAAALGADANPLAELRLALGDALAEAQDAEGARAQFQAAAGRPSEVLDRALVRLAWSRLAAGQDSAALADLERFERECTSSPERPRALTLRGEALSRLGRHAEAAQFLTDARLVVREPAARALVLEKLGIELARSERWREAADALAEFTREYPSAAGVPAAELERGRALARLGDARGSRVCLERALAAGGAIAARARVERARLARAAGDLEGALSDALKAALLVDDPESTPDALLLAAEILTEQGETTAARARLLELVERHPRAPAAVRAAELLRKPAESSPRAGAGGR
ncbi:MAG: tetratricopeptide repeat protein [Planctomycetota bacterium]|nr:tetratricopeptide repeat protein [Planctomycetota bacterium]